MLQFLEFLSLGLVQFCIVRQGEVRVIESRGKFSRVAAPGIHVLMKLWGWGEYVGRFNLSELIPDKDGQTYLRRRTGVELIPLRLQVDDYPKETIITKDNATIAIDAVVYYRLFDPEKAVYQVDDFVASLQKLVQSALRDECGKFDLDDLLTSREKINNQLRIALDEATDPWGIKVERVEIKDIDLGTFGKILAEQRAAETKRRTEITEAEGHKRALVLRSEGEREAAILSAEGNKIATILRAEADRQSTILAAEAQADAMLKLREAEARGFAMLKQVFDGHESGEQILRVLAMQRAREVSAEMAKGEATKIFLPADIQNLFGLVSRRAE